VSIREFRFSGTTDKQLIDFVRRQAIKTEEIKFSDFAKHVGKVLDLTVPVITIPEPTPEEIAKTEWFEGFHQLNRILTVTTSIPDLATPPVTTLINNLRTTLEANWLTSYLGDI